jgi:two-component system sensor histidine kinase/response regulator
MALSGSALASSYDHRLVALSVFIAFLASYAALDLAGRVTSARGGIRLLWLSGGASAMGIGIWSMHYIGMLALRLPIPVEYDWPTVLLSLLAAILASAVALFVVSRRKLGLTRALAGSLFMGTGIAAMHYIGMAAMRLQAMCSYSPGLVTLSFVLAVVISFVALYLTFYFRGEKAGGGWKKALTAVVMGGAIPVMHYTGMAAASFTSQPGVDGSLAYAVSISSLGAAGIVIVTFMVLGLVLITSLVDRRFSKKATELESSEQRYRLIVETAFDAFVGINSQGAIVDWNAQAEAMFGWKRSEITGKLLSELIDFQQGGEPEDVRKFLAAAFNETSKGRIETIAKNRDGREFSVEMAISAVHSGELPLFAAFIQDVTQRKRTEEERENARSGAEAASRAKDEFLANMSHEIRTPLNGIIGMTDLALDTNLTPEQLEYLQTIKLSADSLFAVINDILDFSKIEAGKMDLDAIDFDLRETMELTLKTLAQRAGEKGLELLLDIAPNVPEVMRGDSGRLRQIVLNLAGNAIKFTERGEVGVFVQVDDLAGDQRTVHFIVSDTGIGIPPEKHKAIFEAFSQADTSTTRKYGGTGLGLTISSRLVGMMGGRIWVESEVGRGTQFHFTIQLVVSKGNPKDPTTVVSTEALKGLKTLIVDDNATNRRILQVMLENWGMKCAAVAGGDEGLRELSEAHRANAAYSLILSDLLMPGMDGFGFIEKVRERSEFAATTILILTSAGHRGDGSRCRQLGVAGYLLKPTRKSELLAAICRAVGADQQAGERPLITQHCLLGAEEGAVSLHVLLAEDNAVNQKLAIRLLEKRGHRVTLAGNGNEALKLFEDGTFDLILMDVQMPEMDGFEAVAAIRRVEASRGNRGRTPVIALTAHAMKGDRDRCLAAGMDGYLSKPLRPPELDEILKKYSMERNEIPQPAETTVQGK